MPGSSWMTLCFIIACTNSLSTALQVPRELERVGTVINILENFGDLDLEFRVTPRNDTEHWIFNSDPVFALNDVALKRTHYDGSIGEFRLEVCRGENELLDSFFRHMSIEGVEQSWKAFSRGWSMPKIPRTLGLSSDLNSDDGYILLKLDMKKEEIQMTNQEFGLSKAAQKLFEKIAVNDTSSVFKFLEKYGTHYIHSYSTGNSLFQVLAYKMNDLVYLEEKLKNEGASNMTYSTLSKYFSPLFAKEVGRVMVTSGHFNATVWANGLLSRKYGKIDRKFPSLFSLMWKPWLLEQFDKLESNSITSLKLKLIERAIKEPSDRKQWFQEITHYLIELNEEQA